MAVSFNLPFSKLSTDSFESYVGIEDRIRVQSNDISFDFKTDSHCASKKLRSQILKAFRLRGNQPESRVSGWVCRRLYRQ
jgi:hypothetical protein